MVVVGQILGGRSLTGNLTISVPVGMMNEFSVHWIGTRNIGSSDVFLLFGQQILDKCCACKRNLVFSKTIYSINSVMNFTREKKRQCAGNESLDGDECNDF